MGEALGLAKLVAIIGFMVLFAQLLYGDQGPVQFNVGTAPSFDNPFGARIFTGNFVANGPDAPINIRGSKPSVTNYCEKKENPVTTEKWFGCENSADKAGSYVTIGAIGINQFSVVLGTIPTQQSMLITDVTVVFQCHGNGDGPYADFDNGGPVFLSTANAGDFPNKCRTDGDFNLDTGYANVSVSFSILGSGLHVSDVSGSTVTVYPGTSKTGLGPDDLMAFSYVKVILTASPDSGCGAGDTACQIGALGQFFINLGQLAVNAIVFFFAWIIYGGSILLAVGASLAWFYHIPDMPLSIQSVVDVIVTAFYFMLLYAVVKLIRGSGPV